MGAFGLLGLFVWVGACMAFINARTASAGMTGLALPPLDVSPLQYGGSWASANSLVFTNLMKHSSGWTFGSRTAGTNNSWGYLNPALVRMRPDGYPAGLDATPNTTQWAAVTTIGKDGAYYSAGRYVVLYDGTGTVELGGDAASPPVSSAAGRVVVDVTPSTTGLSVRITSSSPANPVVNIRIVPLANETSYQTFHPEFLDMLRGIPLLRFSSWMRVSGDPNNPRNAPRNWSDRTTPLHSSQIRESDGVAVEHLVELANAAGAHMWIGLPRPANNTDPYITGMVSYIAANLSSNLSLTVEYGVDGPGWISSHLPNATRMLSTAARQAWAAAGRPVGQLRVVMTTPWQSPANTLGYAGDDLSSYVDAYALPGSFGGNAYWAWPGKSNPTAWNDPSYLGDARPQAPDMNTVVRYLRSSVIAADVGYYKSYQWLRGRGVDVLGYMGGPDWSSPLYGARSNYDRAMNACGKNTSTFPCTWNIIYPPLAYSGGPSSMTWNSSADFNVTAQALAANASREASLESSLRQARLNSSLYDMVLDSLWRWHNQTGGGDFVIDLARTSRSCSSAPGYGTLTYAPEECRGLANVTAKPTDTPTYLALKAWLATAAVANGTAAAPGALPRSADELTVPPVPAPPTCLPACVYGTCVNGSCVCWTGVSGATCDVVPTNHGSANATPSVCNQRVGINLEGIADWSRSWTFVDAFKSSRAWIPQSFLPNGPWSTGAPISLINRTDGPGGRTAVGYPAVLAPQQRVSTLVMRDLQGHAPAGVYTVLYDGKGSLDFSMSDVKDIEYVEAGHIRVTFKPSTDFNNGILVVVERTDPNDPVRNIRVLTPGYEQAAEHGDQPFHPAFLAFLRPFGLIRFMDWMQSNAEELPREWEERPRVEDISYAYNLGGVPLELMLQLVNMLGADPWFNMPFAASDNYIAKFAEAVRDGLRPDLRVYVEYGNELWHTGFPGGRYAQAMGLTLNTTQEGSRWYGGATNEARLCFVAQRTANISKIWKAVWANSTNSSSRVNQVVVVVSGQAVWNITSDKLLSCGNASANIDALAIAPYFGSYNATRDTNLTVFMNTTLPAQVNETMALVKSHAAIAAKYGKPLLAYEAGQGMTGDGSSNDLAIQANRHPAMAGIYKTYMEGLAAANVSRIVHFSSIGSYSRYGSWGLMEAQDAEPAESPKYQGLLSYVNVTKTCTLPSPYSPTICPGPACNSNGVCLSNGKCMCYSGFGGEDCSNVTYVEVYNCGYKCTFDQGWCNVSTVRGRTRTWSCTCKPGITGLTCSIVSCPNNCSWNGECLDQGICACYPGFKGADCSVDCGCGGHGRCALGNSSGCICDVGWRLGPSGKCDRWECSGCARGTSCVGPGECGCETPCVYGTCFHGACRCWAGYGGPACDIPELEALAAGVPFVPRLNRGSLAGANLPGTSYWSTEWVWIDVMKGSSQWMTANAPDTALENRWDTGVRLELLPDGYPARLPPGVVAHKLLLRDVLLHAWPGRYIVLYDGDGRLDFGFDAKVSSRAKGRLEIIFRPTADPDCAATGAAYCGDNGIHLLLLATNPANPLRNIRIVPTAEAPAASAGGAGAGGAWESRLERAPFHPWFLKSIARYGVLRFMDWQDTNNDEDWGSVVAGNVTGWAARKRPDADSQAGPGGTALEYLVRLCNLVGADPWVNVHHLADDAYVTALATMLRDNLRPDVNVYVEHSNEVWNPLFSQAQYARARGVSLNLSSNPTIASYRYHMARTARIATIFRTVFASPRQGPGPAPANGSVVGPPPGPGSSASSSLVVSGSASRSGPGRVKVVLGGWGYLCGTNGTGCGAVVLNETLGWGGTLLQQAANGSASAIAVLQQFKVNASLATPDFFGVTGYWNCGLGQNGAQDVLLSVDQMLARCSAALNATEAATRALVAVAERYGVPLVTYEAGPSIVEAAAIERGSSTTGLALKFNALNRHPAMYGLYSAYLDAFRRSGLIGEGRPFMQFVTTGSFTKYGSWGLQEFTGQPAKEAPKYWALMDWLDRQANFTAGFLSMLNSGGGSGGGSAPPGNETNAGGICGCRANVSCNGTVCIFPIIPTNGTACGCSGNVSGAGTAGGPIGNLTGGPPPGNLTGGPRPGNLTGNFTGSPPGNFSGSTCCWTNITANGTGLCFANITGIGMALCSGDITANGIACCMGNATAPGPGNGTAPGNGTVPGNGMVPIGMSSAINFNSTGPGAGNNAPAPRNDTSNAFSLSGWVSFRRPLCLSLTALGGPAAGVSGTAGGGGMALGEGVLMGPPAVSQPAAGQVVIQGLTARIRWSTLGWRPDWIHSAGFEITLWYESDCVSFPPTGETQREQQKNSSLAVAVLPRPTIAGALDVQVPLPEHDEQLAYWIGVAAEADMRVGRRLPRFFLRFSDGITTNYSEPFVMSPGVEYKTSNWTECNCTGTDSTSPFSYRSRNLGCVGIPELVVSADWLVAAYNGSQPVPPPATAFCDPFPTWNLTRPANDPHCSIDENGCRNYRTSNVGGWPHSNFKPVTDCTAQNSPWPLPSVGSTSAALPPNASTPRSPQLFDLSVCEGLIRASKPPLTELCVCDGPRPLPASSPIPWGPPTGGSRPSPSLAPGGLPSRSPPPPIPYCSRSSTRSSLAALQAGIVPCSLNASSLAATSGVEAQLQQPPSSQQQLQLQQPPSSQQQLQLQPPSSQQQQQQQCGADSVCRAVPNCRHYTCDPAAQALVAVSCEALCQPLSLSPLGARLSDDGRAVVVLLSASAAPLTATSCDRIFEPQSANLLGGRGALCSTTTLTVNTSATSNTNATQLYAVTILGSTASLSLPSGSSMAQAAVPVPVLAVRLAASAALTAGVTLTLLTSGSALVGALNASRAFTGSVTVAPCASCAAPTTVLSGPASLSRSSCTSAAAALLPSAALRPLTTFDATQSVDPSGRATFVGITWSVPSEEGLSTAALAALRAAVSRSNAKLGVSDRLTLSLTSAEEAALDDGVSYTLQVTTNSWLGTASTANVTFSVVANNSAPTVSISGPATQTVRISSGLRLSAEVVGGACKGRSLSWSWTSPSGWSGLLSTPGATSGQQLFLRAPLANLTHGQNVTVRVTATYPATGGSAAASGYAEVVVVAAGSPPRVALSGPAGDVRDGEALVFNATASSDPDAPSDPRGALLYLWECTREDYPTPCFNTSDIGDAYSSPGVWTVPAGLLSSEVWHTVTVTVYKEVVEGASPLNATAAVTFRPRSAEKPFPRGTLSRRCAAAACAAPHNTGRDLTVLLELEAPYDTATAAAEVIVTWAVSGLIADLNTAPGSFLLTLPSALLPASQGSVTITADMTVMSSGLSGSAVLTVPLNGAPYCTLSSTNAAACLALTTLNTTFPNAAFTLRAQGWADAGATDSSSAQLKYEFGVRQNVTRGNGNGAAAMVVNLVQQLGTATSATLLGLPQGVVQLYGCAIDVDGSRACASVTVTVEPPAADFNATAALVAVNVTELLQANNPASLLQAAAQMAQLALMAAASGGSDGGNSSSSPAAVSELVASMGVALVEAMMSGGTLQDAEQAPQAISTMLSLASSAASLPESAKTAFMTAVKSAATALGGTSTSTSTSTISADALDSFVLQLCSLLGATLPTATNATSATNATNATNATTTANATTSSTNSTSSSRRLLQDSQASAATKLQDTLTVSDRIGNALSQQAEPLGPFLTTGDNGVYVSAAALPTTEATTSTGDDAVVIVGLSAGPATVAEAAAADASSSPTTRRRGRLLAATTSASTDADAELVLAGAAAAAGSGYGIDLQYLPGTAAALATAVAALLPASATILSGLVTVSWNPGSGAGASPPMVTGNASYLAILIPASGYDPNKTAACLSYNSSTNTVAGSLPGLTAPAGTAATAVYDNTTGRLSCMVTAPGSYFVAQAVPQVMIEVEAPARAPSPAVRASPSPAVEDDDDHPLNIRAVVGAVVGSVVGLVLLAMVVVVIAVTAARRRQRAQIAAAGGVSATGDSQSAVPPVDGQQGPGRAVGEGLEMTRRGSSNRIVPLGGAGSGGAGSGGGVATRAEAALARQGSVR